MNVGQFMQKLKDMYAAAIAKNWFAAAMIAWELIQVIINSMPVTEFNMPPKAFSYGVVVEGATEAELLNELDRIMQRPTYAAAANDSVTASPLIPILLPILFALLKKWLSL